VLNAIKDEEMGEGESIDTGMMGALKLFEKKKNSKCALKNCGASRGCLVEAGEALEETYS